MTNREHYFLKCKELEKENERLNSKLSDYATQIGDLTEERNDYYAKNEQLKREIEDFQTLLASKEEIYLKPVITMIDEKMEQCVLFEDNKCAVILSELKQELKGDVE